MKKILIFSFLLASIQTFARGEKELINQQKKQEKIIKSAHNKGKITELEYDKLMNEQQIIKSSIRKAALDGVWTSRELNYVNGKLERAEKRLIRYKNNSEIY
jgi:hypothetical protein